MVTNANISAADMSRELCARAPGKAIICGEHAVIYGGKALAIAVQQHTTVRFKPISQSPVINTLFSGISMGASYPLHAISRLKDKLDERFEQFSAGNLPVQRILTRPDDLLIYTLCTLAQHLPSRGTIKHLLPSSGQLLSQSNIPCGAGMGSSAAAIAATMVLYEHLLERRQSAEQRYELVRFCERLQHGKGSAIDAATVVYGGAVVLDAGVVRKLEAVPQNWFWLFSGTPQTSTGECVQYVKRHYGKDNLLWAEFAAVLDEFIACFNSGADMRASIRANAALLARIGVVPKASSDIINAIEQQGGAAKISGAGAVAGDYGGLLLAYMPAGQAQLAAVIDKFKISNWGALAIDSCGAHFVE